MSVLPFWILKIPLQFKQEYISYHKSQTNSGLRAFKRSDIPEEYHYRRRFWDQQKQEFCLLMIVAKFKCYLKVSNFWTSAQTRLQYWWSQKKELWSWLQGKSPVHGYIDLCLSLFLIVLTPFCSWRSSSQKSWSLSYLIFGTAMTDGQLLRQHWSSLSCL